MIMIGGSGADFSGADHGIGTTVAKLASFKSKKITGENLTLVATHGTR